MTALGIEVQEGGRLLGLLGLLASLGFLRHQRDVSEHSARRMMLAHASFSNFDADYERRRREARA